MDLNIIIETNGVRDDARNINGKLLRCKELGFQTIALAVVYDARDGKVNSLPNSPKLSDLSVPKDMKVFTRLTVIISENIQAYKVSKCKERSEYDILAYEPQNSKILHHLATGSCSFEILTFSLIEKLDYNMFKVNLQKLKQQGVCVELNYGPAQLSSALRRNVIGNGQSLTEKSTRNVILSNGINDVFRLRGPKDAKYLGVLFLMSVNKCHDAVYNNGMNAINLAKHRGNPASSAIVLLKDD